MISFTDNSQLRIFLVRPPLVLTKSGPNNREVVYLEGVILIHFLKSADQKVVLTARGVVFLQKWSLSDSTVSAVLFLIEHPKGK